MREASKSLQLRQAKEKGTTRGFWKASSQFLPQLTILVWEDTIKSQFIYPRGGQIENKDLRKQKAQLKVMHYILNTECLTIHFTAHFLLLVNASKHSESKFTFFMSNILTVFPSSSLSPVKQTLRGQSVHTIISCDTKP